MSNEQTRNGHTARTKATTEQVLEAAEHVFLLEGFERAQIESIAKAAGRTKGAIYSHFKNKEELFLALLEKRIYEQVGQLKDRAKATRSREDGIAEFRKFLLEMLHNKRLPLLILEFKLYAMRHPESRARWIEMHDMIRVSSSKNFRRELVGRKKTEKYRIMETNLAALGPILSAILLESHFETVLMSPKRLEQLVQRILDCLLDHRTSRR